MGVTVQDDYNLGATDLLSPDKATPFVHGHLKLDEGGGDTLLDSSGNGRHLTWNTTGTNATAAAAGVWTVNGLEYGAGTVAGDSFNAAVKGDYDIGDNSKTWIAVVQFAITLAPAATVNLFSARGGAGGAVDAGHEFQLNVTPRVQCSIHNGTSQLGITNSGSIGATNERFTAAIAVDVTQSSFGSIKMITCADTTAAHVQFKESSWAALSALNDTSTSNDFTCIGQRSSVNVANLTKNVIFRNVRCYSDPAGGATPDNLGDIVRWLHQNPEANIPAVWWS